MLFNKILLNGANVQLDSVYWSRLLIVFSWHSIMPLFDISWAMIPASVRLTIIYYLFFLDPLMLALYTLPYWL